MTKGVALAAGLIAVLAAYPSAAPARPKPAGSLCRAPGAVLSTCDIGTKTVSICGQETSGLVVQSKGRTVSSRECSALPATFEQLTETLVPAGDYVPH